MGGCRTTHVTLHAALSHMVRVWYSSVLCSHRITLDDDRKARDRVLNGVCLVTALSQSFLVWLVRPDFGGYWVHLHKGT
jgi:hypothetical protein